MYENLSIVDREMTLDEWKRIDNSLDYDDPDSKSLRRVLWRDVAEQYVLLAHVPSKFITSKKAYFYFDYLATGEASSILFKGRLPDVGKLDYHRGANSSPTYWWPEDRSWCIYADFDLRYTLIGANEAAIRALENDAEIEGFQIEANLNFIRRKIVNMPRR